jgi:hypothetical protein
MTEDNKDKGKGGTGRNLAIFGCLVTGVLACSGGVAGMLNSQISGAGVCFIAAAFAFGGAAYVSFSD